MKRIVISLFSLTLALGALVPLAKAATPNSEYGLNAFNLTTVAYQGRLSEDGIPGYGSLANGVNSGSITAEDVIQAAVDSGRLSEMALQDSEFVRTVSNSLNRLDLSH